MESDDSGLGRSAAELAGASENRMREGRGSEGKERVTQDIGPDHERKVQATQTRGAADVGLEAGGMGKGRETGRSAGRWQASVGV